MITHTVPNARATGAPGRGRTLPVTWENRPDSIACRHATGPWAIGGHRLTIAIPPCARGTGHSGQPPWHGTVPKGTVDIDGSKIIWRAERWGGYPHNSCNMGSRFMYPCRGVRQ